MAILIILLGAASVVLGNLGTAKAYETRELEGKLSDLRRENRKLELEVVKASAAEAIAAEVLSLGLIPAHHVAYLETGATEVAKR